MALKPTIYKFTIALSDLNKHYYDSLNLTVPLHPSETLERMMVRVLAYCINAQEHLEFTQGLAEIDDPDIWLKTLDNLISLWIDVGEPAPDRVKKATRLAKSVSIYTFNSKSDAWWEKSQSKLSQLNASVYQFSWKTVQELAELVERGMSISVTITDNSLFVATDSGECDISWKVLQEK